MKILYIDEAGNTGMDLKNKQQPIFTLCGIVVDDADWYELNHHIQNKKIEIYPELKSAEIHASDIFNSSKNDQKGFDFRKNDYHVNLSILEKIVDLIVEIKFDIFAFNVKKDVYMDNLKKYVYPPNSTPIKIPEPYVLSFMRIVKEYDDYLVQNDCNGMILKDEINSVENEIDNFYKAIFSDDSNTYNIIESAISLDSKKNTFLQLADVCNFYINKYHSIELYDTVKNKEKKEHCLKQYNKLKPLIKIVDNDDFLKN